MVFFEVKCFVTVIIQYLQSCRLANLDSHHFFDPGSRGTPQSLSGHKVEAVPC